jgi:ornithine cyclodeaminase/alanine dehydrogenase
VLVVPVHTRGFTNCDLFFDKIFADDTGHVDHFRNFKQFKYFAEMSDVVNGTAEGRESDKLSDNTREPGTGKADVINKGV